MASKKRLAREHEVTFNRIVRRATLLPMGVMILASLFLAWLVTHLLTVTNWVDHTDKVIGQAQHTERLILDMEAGMRGYLVTGDTNMLKTFERTEAEIGPALDVLSAEVSDNSTQVERITNIRAGFGKWLAYARDLLDRRQRGAEHQSIQRNASEMALMNSVRDEFDRFLGLENDLRVERQQQVQKIEENIRSWRWFILLALGLSLGLYLRKQLRGVARLYETALTTTEQKSEALQVSEASLLEAQTKLRQYAEDLEQTVAERTAQLRETVGELEAYSYSVSHDLRAPLRAMQGYARVLLTDCGPQLSPEGKIYLERITAATDRMDRLIHDILNYSRLTRLEIKSEPVDLENLINEIIQQYPALKSVDGQIKVEKPLPRLMVPEALLTQCLSNLLNNAVKFVHEGVPAQVLIRAETHGTDVRIWIEDNGIGIAPAYQERIFGVFERIPGKQAYEGTGIGLAIVRKAAERMGGTVGVESALGKGSRFWINLPGRKL